MKVLSIILSVVLGLILIIFLRDVYKTIHHNGNPFIPVLICLSIILISISGFILRKKYQRVSEVIQIKK
jgi:uncharacterized membrane protein